MDRIRTGVLACFSRRSRMPGLIANARSVIGPIGIFDPGRPGSSRQMPTRSRIVAPGRNFSFPDTLSPTNATSTPPWYRQSVCSHTT